jgi:hypothetical protein
MRTVFVSPAGGFAAKRVRPFSGALAKAPLRARGGHLLGRWHEPSKPDPGPPTRAEAVTESENGVRGEEIFFSFTPFLDLVRGAHPQRICCARGRHHQNPLPGPRRVLNCVS